MTVRSLKEHLSGHKLRSPYLRFQTKSDSFKDPQNFSGFSGYNELALLQKKMGLDVVETWETESVSTRAQTAKNTPKLGVNCAFTTQTSGMFHLQLHSQHGYNVQLCQTFEAEDSVF